MRKRITLWMLAGVLAAGIAVAAGTAGQLDSTFGSGGIAIEGPFDNMRLYLVGEQSDGKLIGVGRDSLPGGDGTVAPITGWKIRRFNTNGTLDTSFGTSGVVTLFGDHEDWRDDEPIALAVDASNRIVISGRTYTPVPSNGKGKKSAQLVGRVTVARLLVDGDIDTSFGGGNGFVRTDVNDNSGSPFGNAVMIDGAGRIVVGGIAPVEVTFEVQGRGNKTRTRTSTRNRPLLIRYNADGTLDTAFGVGGMVIDDDPVNGEGEREERIATHGVHLLSDGSIHAVITSDDQVVFRKYSSAGARVAGYQFVSQAGVRPYGITVDVSNRVVLAYTIWSVDREEGFISRYTTAGAVDTTFADNGTLDLLVDETGDLVMLEIEVLSSGKIVAAGARVADPTDLGAWDSIAIRLDSSGNYDTTFGTGGLSASTTPADRGTNIDGMRKMLIDKNGDIVVGGTHKITAADTFHWFLARWCSD